MSDSGGWLGECRHGELKASCKQCEIDRLAADLAAVRAQLEQERMFPIMDGPDIPWSVIAPCEREAQRNHGQSLEKLASRGGLSPDEAVAVLKGEPWREMPHDLSVSELLIIVRERHKSPCERQLESALTALRAEREQEKAEHEFVLGCTKDHVRSLEKELAEVRARLALPAFVTQEGHNGTAPAPDESD